MAKAARQTDPHSCPQPGHGTQKIKQGEANVLINNLPAAVVSSPISSPCGGKIAKGSQKVFINGKPAARVGDKSDHGGTITAGSPDVDIS